MFKRKKPVYYCPDCETVDAMAYAHETDQSLRAKRCTECVELSVTARTGADRGKQ